MRCPHCHHLQDITLNCRRERLRDETLPAWMQAAAGGLLCALCTGNDAAVSLGICVCS